jgi:hypothetical protein
LTTLEKNKKWKKLSYALDIFYSELFSFAFDNREKFFFGSGEVDTDKRGRTEQKAKVKGLTARKDYVT